MRWTRSHLSFANLVSLMALFVALGGTTYAAVTLPKNSVGSKQIKKRAVRAKHINTNAVSPRKIQGNAVSSPKIADGTVFSADLGDNSVGSSELGDNSVGLSEIASGAVGSDEVTDGSLTEGDLQPGLLDIGVTVQFTQSAADLANGAEVSVDAFCPEGQIGIGGGVRGDLTNSELTKVTANRPIISSSNTGAPADDGSFTGWRGTFVNENNGAGIRPEVWVVCASAGAP
jgi:hypothetical protein